jgi:Zn-dependent M28 family amino/carboxypeptidase
MSRRTSVIATVILVGLPLVSLGQSVSNNDVRIEKEAVAAHLSFLADDLLEGRGIASRGGQLAVLYIESVFRAAGLQPGANGSFRQAVPMLAFANDEQAQVVFGSGESKVVLQVNDEFVLNNYDVPSGELVAEPLFVGYGITAPEEGWDDFKGANVRGKLLIALANEPGRGDSARFRGRALTLRGRWRTKYQLAERLGAAGILLIHTPEDAGYAWEVTRNSWSDEAFFPAERPERVPMAGWVREPQVRALVRMAGLDLDALRRQAERADFRPVPLPVRVQLRARLIERKVVGANVVGVLPGRGENAVVLCAHYDHFGIGASGGEDRIYNGAIDNGTALATMLALAQAYARAPKDSHPPLVFVGADAEEAGLVGSDQQANRPAWPLRHISAVINFEMSSPWGRTRDLMAIGGELSGLGDVVARVAAARGMTVTPDPEPEQGFFFRSDQLAWAQAGVPGIWLDLGIDVIGKPAGWGRAKRAEYRSRFYHQTSDEIQSDFDLDALVQLGEIAADLVRELGQRPPIDFSAGSSFSRAR